MVEEEGQTHVEKEQALGSEKASPPYKPEIHLTIYSPTPHYSLSRNTGIKFKLQAVLQPSSPSIMIKTYDTMFHRLLQAPYPDSGYFNFINVETGKKLRRSYHTDAMQIHDPRLEELSWAHADRFAILTPNKHYTVEHGFAPRSDDLDGLEVGKRYRIELREQDETARIRWWSVGTKMQVLYGVFWPLREPIRTWHPEPEGPVRVVLIESCEIRIVE